VPLVAVIAETEVNHAFAAQLARIPDAVASLSRSDPDVADRSSFSAEESAARRREDQQDADLVRIAAYTGLRLGELRALHWGDVDLATRRVVVQRALSGRVAGPTKSWQTRYVPIADPAADAFKRLAGRVEYTSGDDLVFRSRFGRPLDAAAIRRRFKRASWAVGRGEPRRLTNVSSTKPRSDTAAGAQDSGPKVSNYWVFLETLSWS
jgi:integrase